MVILLVLSALVSGSEVAFFSLDAKDKEALNSNKDNISTRVLDLLARPKRLLATILIANNFVNIAIVILSTFIINNLCDFEGNKIAEFVTTVVIATFLILMVGEVIPKVYANSYNIRFSKISSSGTD